MTLRSYLYSFAVVMPLLLAGWAVQTAIDSYGVRGAWLRIRVVAWRLALGLVELLGLLLLLAALVLVSWPAAAVS